MSTVSFDAFQPQSAQGGGRGKAKGKGKKGRKGRKGRKGDRQLNGNDGSVSTVAGAEPDSVLPPSPSNGPRVAKLAANAVFRRCKVHRGGGV